MPDTPIDSPGGAAVGPGGMVEIEGIDGMLGMLGMEMPGKLEMSRVALFMITNPTPAATIRNTTAIPANSAHGMPADDLRCGGCAHGAPYPGGGYGPCACGGIGGNGGGAYA